MGLVVLSLCSPLAPLLSMGTRVHWLLLPCQVRALDVHGEWPKNPMVWRALQLIIITITLLLPSRPMAKMTTGQVAGESTKVRWLVFLIFFFLSSFPLPTPPSFFLLSNLGKNLRVVVYIPGRHSTPLSCTLSSYWVISFITQSLHYLLGALTYSHRASYIWL